MRKVILLSTTIMIAPFMAGEVSAQCAATQDCASLGYTETSNKGGCLKCPFGNYWACKGSGEADKAVLGQCTGYAKNCKIGNILNNDGTCSSKKVSGKTPIGVVIYISPENCGWAIASKSISGMIVWRDEVNGGKDVVTTSNWKTAINNFDSCGNTQTLTSKGSNGIYPAAWAAVNYAPSAAPATKGKWCLPAPGVLNSLYTNLSTVDYTLVTIGGEQFVDNSLNIWASSDYDNSDAWTLCATCDEGAKQGGLNNWMKWNAEGVYVRPVIEF
ncbi:MAG: hypothetical protein Q4F75_03625 [Pseudomonadota bacterium]|nr:hypothetical protein [Pseudomonadota bacterium]